MNYTEYLQKKGYSETTIESYDLAKSRFIEWCKKQGTSANEIDYKKLLSYTKSLTRKGNSKRTVNHKLAIIKNYFEYLMKQSCRVDNPAEGIIIKGVVKKQLYNLLEAEELEDLYYSYETENIKDPYHRLTAKRNKVIVGLMVYQGLNTTSLIQLEVAHVTIYKGKIYIPSTKRTNARELELKPWQVIELLEYIKETREEIKQRKMIESERLFIPNNARLGNTILNIIKKLKKYNSKVDNSNQIRASVLSSWTKQYNLRKVQVMAGHRYISSTEKYVQDDLENLQEVINLHHPLR